MKTSKKINFWNRQYFFDFEKFRTFVDAKIQSILGNQKPESIEYDIEVKDDHLVPVISDSKKELSFICPPISILQDVKNNKREKILETQIANAYFELKDAEALRNLQKLVYLTLKENPTGKEKEKIEEIWNRLEKIGKLKFPTKELRKIVLQKIGMNEEKLSGEEEILSPEGKDRLFKFLKMDYRLLLEPSIIEFISVESRNESSEFIKNLPEVLKFPVFFKGESNRGRNQRSQKPGPPLYVKDWVFAQIYYYQKCAPKEEHKGLKELFPEISENFYSAIKEKFKGFKGEYPSESAIENWYTERRETYERIFSKNELTTLVNKHVLPTPKK